MKRSTFIFIVVLISTSSIFLGCSSDELDVIGQYSYLDFSQNKSYETQIETIEEAAKRMDEYVHYRDGKFILTSCDSKKLNISPSVYNYMLSLMDLQNEVLCKTDGLCQVSDKSFVVYSEVNFIVPLKTRSESNSGGINDCIVEYTWHSTYVHVYISNDTLRYTSYVSQAAAISALLAPEPTMATKAVAAACQLASLACNILRDEYPNGIIISIMVPAHIGPCIPYGLSSQ